MKEELEFLQAILNKSHNDLCKIAHNKITLESDITFESHIELKDQDRSCKIYPFFFSEIPKYVFEWDDCPIFEISSTNVKRQGEIIIDWVLEKSMPSKIQTKFSEIKLSKLAKYYENGEGIKGEFIESWNLVEETSNNLVSVDSDQYCAEKDVIRLIKEMRNFKLNESLRAGTQLGTFIVSRSRRHGIDENAPQIKIGFLGGGRMNVCSNLKGQTKSLECKVKYEGYLEGIVIELLKEKVE